MSVRVGWICAAAIVMLCGNTGTAEAQSVSFTSSGYSANNPPTVSSTIAPYGNFSVPMNMAGQYRVSVVYGTLTPNGFLPYNPVPNGVPPQSYSTAQNIGANGGVFPWSIASTNVSGISKDTQIQAQLQFSTDGKNWKPAGNPSLIAAIVSQQ